MNRYFLFVILICCSCFSLAGRGRKSSAEVQSMADVLSGLEQTSPAVWHQGMPFLFVGDCVGISLTPEVPIPFHDTIPMYGTTWYYDSMVSEEDWMGQELLQLRFIAPDGSAYRYSTGRPMSMMTDTSYLPALGVLYPECLIRRCDSLLRARTLYILYNDERVVFPQDSAIGSRAHQKFVPIVIDSVRIGTEVAPLCVHFSSGEEHGYFLSSLPGSRQESTSTPITRFLSTTDPYSSHPDITPEVWEKIRYSQLQVDMTAEEVRLSWGRPSRIEKVNSRTGIVELWFYSNNRVVQIWDGRLNKIGAL